MATLTVPTTGSLADAIRSAKPHDTVRLATGLHAYAGASVPVTQEGLTIVGDAGAVIDYTSPPPSNPSIPPDAMQLFDCTAAGITFDNLKLQVRAGKSFGFRGNSADVTLRRIVMDGANIRTPWVDVHGTVQYFNAGGYYGIDVDSCTRMTLDNCVWGWHASYCNYFRHVKGWLKFLNPVWAGSMGQHACRISDSENIEGHGGYLGAAIHTSDGPGRGVGGLTVRSGVNKFDWYGGKIVRPGVGAQHDNEPTTYHVFFHSATATEPACEIIGGVALYRAVDVWVGKTRRDNPAA